MRERPRLGTSRRSFGPVFDQRAGFPLDRSRPCHWQSGSSAATERSVGIMIEWPTVEGGADGGGVGEVTASAEPKP